MPVIVVIGRRLRPFRRRRRLYRRSDPVFVIGIREDSLFCIAVVFICLHLIHRFPAKRRESGATSLMPDNILALPPVQKPAYLTRRKLLLRHRCAIIPFLRARNQIIAI